MNQTYEQLIAENERLRIENENLRKLLGLRGNKQRFTALLSLEEKVALFKSLFSGRKDVFARRWYSSKTNKGGYQPVCLNEWQNGICDKKKQRCSECPNRQFKSLEYQDIYNHLAGRDFYCRDVIGLYPILEDNTVRFLCVDFDDKSCEYGYKDDVMEYVYVSREWGVECHIERSRSGNGAHVWTFFAIPIHASEARRVGNAILTEAMMRRGKMSFRSYDRMFPNQNEIEKGRLGNLIALPLQGMARKVGNSVFVDDNFSPFDDQWAYLKTIRPINRPEINEFLKKHGNIENQLGPLSTSSENKPWKTAPAPIITRNDFASVIEIVRANMVHIPLKQLSGKVVNYLKRIASFRNPEFYKKMAMRLTTHDTPRIITCAQISDEYISLPRGCEEVITSWLEEQGIPYTLSDKTTPGHKINATFKGVLRSDQSEAIASLITHRNGILHATTAFGKTIAAIGLIAHKQLNTLILVHNKALLDQWKERLTTFLGIDFHETDAYVKRGRKKEFSPFGTLDSTGNSLHGEVDIALLQSCLDDSESGVKPFVREYGMIIIDECHHAPAVTFERVLRYINARYVYGLTATLTRQDGLQGIIFMQCGQVRFTSTPKQQIALQNFSRILISRFTSYRNLSGNKLNYIQLCREIAEDKNRNELIIKDIIKTVNEGRTPIVLTTLTSHVKLLSTLLNQKLSNTSIVTLFGSEKTKDKRDKMAYLHSVEEHQKLVIIATGKYVGEGFDYARLDTLMLVSPISGKGLIAQYAGRLHREHNNKNNVKIYDYIDFHVPLADIMYRRRLKGYAEIGYVIGSSDKDGNDHTENIFRSSDYFKVYLEDIRNAKKSILISVPKIYLPHFTPVLEVIQENIYNGVVVHILTTTANEYAKRIETTGARVEVSNSANISSVIIDGRTCWYGDVNYFANTTGDTYALRLADSSLAESLTQKILNTPLPPPSLF